MTTSTLDVITSAMQKLGALGADQSAPDANDQAIALREYNQILGQMNLRRRNAYFIRTQAWAFSTARDSYSIGASTDSPNFAVTTGGRPTELLDAKIVMTDTTPNIELDCQLWTFQQYKNQINIPTLASSFPRGIYYQPTTPNGTIFPYPSNPTKTSYKLQLSWSDQMLEVAIADISTAVRFSMGQERFLTLELAMALSLIFPIRTNLDELRRQRREAKADYQVQNQMSKVISTTDGMTSGSASGWSWISRR
jgi:hypothetical protein